MATKGVKQSEEHIKKRCLALKGKFVSEKIKLKISRTLKGRKMSDEQKAKLRLYWNNKPRMSEETKDKIRKANFGKLMTPEQIQKLRDSHTGKKLTEKTKEKLRLYWTGRKRGPASEKERARLLSYVKGKVTSIETRKKLSEIGKKRVSDGLHNNYKGGITKDNIRIRVSLEYRLWRESVFKRDNFTCIWCGQVGGKIQADHIKPFAYYPELRFAIDNGRTLCKPCHLKTDTWGNRHYKINHK